MNRNENNKFSTKFLSILIKLLITQSDRILSNITFTNSVKDMSKRYCQIIFITIWLICATILTRSFTSLLLNTYFNLKYGPLFDSLEDLINNRDLNIVLDIENYEEIFSKFGYDDILSEIIKRTKIYQKRSKLTFHVNYIPKSAEILKHGFIENQH